MNFNALLYNYYGIWHEAIGYKGMEFAQKISANKL